MVMKYLFVEIDVCIINQSIIAEFEPNPLKVRRPGSR